MWGLQPGTAGRIDERSQSSQVEKLEGDRDSGVLLRAGVPLGLGARDLPSAYPKGLAKAQPRSDWADPSFEALELLWSDLDSEQRERLARGWTELGLRKHAQIACLSRLTTWLLRLGAPWELIVRAQQAGSAAVAHAEQIFGIASALHQRKVGPGPSDSRDARLPQVEALLRNLVVEGYAVQTAASVQSDWCAASVGSERIARQLRKMARDEGLAADAYLRTAEWLMAVQPGLETGLLAAARELQVWQEGPGSREDEPWLAYFGVLSPVRSTELRRQAWEEILLPELTAQLRASGLDWQLIAPSW